MSDMAEKLALEILHGEAFRAPDDCAENALRFAKEYADTHPIFAAMLTRCAEVIVALLSAPASQPAALNEPSGNSGRLAGVAIPDEYRQAIASPPMPPPAPKPEPDYSGKPKGNCPLCSGNGYTISRGHFRNYQNPCECRLVKPAPSAGEQA